MRPLALSRTSTRSFPLTLAFGLILQAGVSSAGDRGRAEDLPRADKVTSTVEDPRPARSWSRDLGGGNARATGDTIWFGGLDPETGTGIPGGIWDFEDGSTQGWRTEMDLSDNGSWFRRRIRADFDGSDPEVCVINQDASMWCGRHQRETACWPGGLGYGNYWTMHAEKSFPYHGSGGVTLSFEYFVDSELGYDFTYVYVHPQESPVGQALRAYSGSFDNQSPPANIGSPTDPANELLVVDAQHLPGQSQSQIFTVRFTFSSDYSVSDQYDPLYPYYLDCRYGPFGFDDFVMTEGSFTDVDDFEAGMDDWTTYTEEPIGPLMQVLDLDDLDPIESDDCGCALLDPDNDYVMIAADLDPTSFPHPIHQNEVIMSPPIYVGGNYESYERRLVRLSHYSFLPSWGPSWSLLIYYFPWTCPETGEVEWQVGDGDRWYGWNAEPDCRTLLYDLSTLVPTDVESLRIALQMENDYNAELGNQTPYWDDIQLGLVDTGVDAPLLSYYTEGFGDAFPSDSGTLLASATADVHATWDTLPGPQIHLGNGVNSFVPPAPDVHVYLNYRVLPGPSMNLTHRWYVDEYLPRSGGPHGWAEVEMDSMEVHGRVEEGAFTTFVHEGDALFTTPELGPDGKLNLANKIIEDDVLTPGTQIEYFYTTQYGAGPKATWPDTSVGNCLEFEILPGYVRLDETTLLAPCFLYVDWGQKYYPDGDPVETYGLEPYLGTTSWAHQEYPGLTRVADNWDRWDDVGANWVARGYGSTNGISQYQSMAYRTMLYEADRSGWMRDDEARFFRNWLANDDFDRYEIRKGLWLSGNAWGRNLYYNTTCPECSAFLESFAGARPTTPESYREHAQDPSYCVRVDPSVPRDFPPSSDGYASLAGNGCPTNNDFTVLEVFSGGEGNLDFVNQDAGGLITQFASVSNDGFTATSGNRWNFGMVLDGFSLQFLRATADGFTGDGTDACTDHTAITRRVADVLDWFDSTAGILCDPPIIDVDESGGAPAIARTRLYPNAPNPFNPVTTVRYDLATSAIVRLGVYDTAGRLVRTLVDGVQKPDRYTVSWDGSTTAGAEVASGVYWVQMRTSTGFRSTTKMVLLR